MFTPAEMQRDPSEGDSNKSKKLGAVRVLVAKRCSQNNAGYAERCEANICESQSAKRYSKRSVGVGPSHPQDDESEELQQQCCRGQQTKYDYGAAIREGSNKRRDQAEAHD